MRVEGRGVECRGRVKRCGCRGESGGRDEQWMSASNVSTYMYVRISRGGRYFGIVSYFQY